MNLISPRRKVKRAYKKMMKKDKKTRKEHIAELWNEYQYFHRTARWWINLIQ